MDIVGAPHGNTQGARHAGKQVGIEEYLAAAGHRFFMAGPEVTGLPPASALQPADSSMTESWLSSAVGARVGSGVGVRERLGRLLRVLMLVVPLVVCLVGGSRGGSVRSSWACDCSGAPARVGVAWVTLRVVMPPVLRVG